MDNFLRFLEKDHSFLTPWAAPIPEDQQLQQEVQQEIQVDRKENDQAETPFSFFSRQWDYYENLRKAGEGRSDDSLGGESVTIAAAAAALVRQGQPHPPTCPGTLPFAEPAE